MILIVEIGLLTALSCNAQIRGCTDPLANNYDPQATINDGSCTYDPVSVSPRHTYAISDQLKETSGLILWDGILWTHNDNADKVLYGLDTITADIERTYILEGVENLDWEEISQDEAFIYLGDFGNNGGSRTDLHILRIEKSSLIAGAPDIDTIWFSYSDQTDFSPREDNQTDYDCEAMIVTDDSIYLFTKQWISTQTSVYRMPKTPGNHHAIRKDDYNVQGLVTGATFLELKSLVVLCGYTSMLHPFFTLLYDFPEHDFFSGNKRRITVSLPFHQIEGITTQNGLRYFASNESFIMQPLANSPQKLHLFDLSPFLKDYVSEASSSGTARYDKRAMFFHPNPASCKITVRIEEEIRPAAYQIHDLSARMICSGILSHEVSTIDISHLGNGLYILTVGKQDEIFLFMKQK